MDSERKYVGDLGQGPSVVTLLQGRPATWSSTDIVGSAKYQQLCASRGGTLSPGHDVLTLERGWVSIDKVTVSDAVACIDSETNVLSYQNPSKIYSQDMDGEIYSVRSPTVNLQTALDHLMFVKREEHTRFEFMASHHVACRYITYKRDAINSQPEVPNFTCGTGATGVAVPMAAWMLVYSTFLENGKLIDPPRKFTDDLSAGKVPRLKEKHWRRAVSNHAPTPTRSSFALIRFGSQEHLVPALIGLDKAGVRYWQHHSNVIIESEAICTALTLKSDKSRTGFQLHPFVWALSQTQALYMLQVLHHLVRNAASSDCEYGELQRLALHAGIAAAFSNIAGRYERQNPCRLHYFLRQKEGGGTKFGVLNEAEFPFDNLIGGETIRPYTGKLYGIAVPTGIIYVRRDGVPVWTSGGI